MCIPPVDSPLSDNGDCASLGDPNRGCDDVSVGSDCVCASGAGGECNGDCGENLSDSGESVSDSGESSDEASKLLCPPRVFFIDGF